MGGLVVHPSVVPGVARGWNIKELSLHCWCCCVWSSTTTHPCLAGSLLWWGPGGVWWWGKVGAVVSGCGASTLLGPEGSDPVTPRSPVWWCGGLGLGFSVAGALVPWVIPVHGHHVVRGGCGCVVIVSVWVAGCWLRTVQWTRASVSLLLFVKFLRAHGGCLGTRNRRRT